MGPTVSWWEKGEVRGLRRGAEREGKVKHKHKKAQQEAGWAGTGLRDGGGNERREQDSEG